MGDNVYVHESVRDLLFLLNQLCIIGVKRHKISHSAMMMQSFRAMIQPNWIQVPVTSMYAEFLEIVPPRRQDM